MNAVPTPAYVRGTTASRRTAALKAMRFIVMEASPGRKFNRAFATPRKRRAFVSPTGVLFYLSKHWEARAMRQGAHPNKIKGARQ